MKAISLLQPWATLVVIGAKTIETRNWNTNYRGDILIHTGISRKGGILAGELPFKKYIADFNQLPFGAIIGQATITDVVKIETLEMSDELLNRLTLEEKAFGDYTPGRYAWILENSRVFGRTQPMRGSLRIWDVILNKNL